MRTLSPSLGILFACSLTRLAHSLTLALPRSTSVRFSLAAAARDAERRAAAAEEVAAELLMANEAAEANPQHPFSPYVAPRFPHMSEINSLFSFFPGKGGGSGTFLIHSNTPFPHMWRPHFSHMSEIKCLFSHISGMFSHTSQECHPF